MEIVRPDALQSVSFPDCLVTSFRLTDSEFDCHLDGIYLPGRKLLAADVRLVIRNWKSCSVSRFNLEDDGSQLLQPCESGELKDICECCLARSHASIAGFERYSGCWQTYEFTSATVTVEILSQSQQ
jgi:hypothetical protein